MPALLLKPRCKGRRLPRCLNQPAEKRIRGTDALALWRRGQWPRTKPLREFAAGSWLSTLAAACRLACGSSRPELTNKKCGSGRLFRAETVSILNGWPEEAATAFHLRHCEWKRALSDDLMEEEPDSIPNSRCRQIDLIRIQVSSCTFADTWESVERHSGFGSAAWPMNSTKRSAMTDTRPLIVLIPDTWMVGACSRHHAATLSDWTI